MTKRIAPGRLLAAVASAVVLASCGGSSKTTSTSHNSSSSSSGTTTGSASSNSPTAKAAAAVQTNIQDTTITDAKLSCPSQALPGKGHGFACQISSKYGTGTMTLTQQDSQGRCFLYTGQLGPYSWTPANHNVVCAP